MKTLALSAVKSLIGGGGGGVTVEAKTFTENGTYTAPAGKAYSPVTVNVESGGGDKSVEYIGNLLITDYNTSINIDISAYVDYYDIKLVFVVAREQYTDNGDIKCALIASLIDEQSIVLYYMDGDIVIDSNIEAEISEPFLILRSGETFTPGSIVQLYGMQK